MVCDPSRGASFLYAGAMLPNTAHVTCSLLGPYYVLHTGGHANEGSGPVTKMALTDAPAQLK